MQVVILAAGRGTRMGSATNLWPKPLLNVGGKSILEHTLENLPRQIKKIIFVVGYRGDLIRRTFGEQFGGRDIKYVWSHRLNGSAGALHEARKFLKEKFLVLNGDDLYSRIDLEKIIRHEAAVLAKEFDEPERFGVMELDERGNLKNVVEKQKNPLTNLVNTGAYCLNLNFFEYEPVAISEKEFGLPQTIALMAKDHEIRVERADFWHPINTPEDYEVAQKLFDSLNK